MRSPPDSRFASNTGHSLPQVGAVVFSCAAWLAWVEACNVHLRADIHAWQKAGQQGARPALAWPLVGRAHVKHEWLAWYGCSLRFLGTLFFDVGVATKFAEAHRDLDHGLVVALHEVQFLLGAASVCIAAYMLAAEARHSWLHALLPPMRVNRQSLGHWVAFFNLLGALCFVAGSIVGFVAENLALNARQVVDGCTWVAGSCCFVIKAVLLCAESVVPHA